MAGARLAYSVVCSTPTDIRAQQADDRLPVHVVVERAQRLDREIGQEAALAQQRELAVAGHAASPVSAQPSRSGLRPSCRDWPPWCLPIAPSAQLWYWTPVLADRSLMTVAIRAPGRLWRDVLAVAALVGLLDWLMLHFSRGSGELAAALFRERVPHRLAAVASPGCGAGTWWRACSPASLRGCCRRARRRWPSRWALPISSRCWSSPSRCAGGCPTSAIPGAGSSWAASPRAARWRRARCRDCWHPPRTRGWAAVPSFPGSSAGTRRTWSAW